MDSPSRELLAESPFANLAPYRSPDLEFAPVPIQTLITFTARRDRLEDLQGRAQALWGVSLPPAGRSVTTDATLTVLAIRPHAWLAVRAGLDFRWASQFATDVGTCASVVGTTGAYGLLDLRGAPVPALLARGMFLDFDSEQFPVGAVAVSSLSHFPVILWRLPGASSFRLAVARSVAKDLWEWLQHRAGSLPRGTLS